MLNMVVQTNWSLFGSFSRVDPWTLAFVYPKDSEPLLIKGGLNFVEDEMKKHGPAVIHLSTFHIGGKLTSFRLHGVNAGIKENNSYELYKVRKKYTIYTYPKNGMAYEHVPIKHIRRVPRRWIKELDRYIIID